MRLGFSALANDWNSTKQIVTAKKAAKMNVEHLFEADVLFYLV